MALTFWYEFSSSYSYLSAMRIDAAAEAAGVQLVWQPFLLGPIFKEAGYDGSPNLVSPHKAAYMWADIGRRAAHRGIPFVQPAVFPQDSVRAARAALGVEAVHRAAFSRAVFGQVFGHGADISDPVALGEAADEVGLDAQSVMARAAAPKVKQALFAAVDAARGHGIFGAPSFVTGDGTLFWGDDRLADALAWEKSGTLALDR